MAFKIQLKFDNKEYDDYDSTYSFKRDVDARGHPASSIYGEITMVQFELFSDTSLLESMVKLYCVTSGYIAFVN